jgi:hypothetical protein
MKITDILTEYRRDKTVANLGNRLIDAINNDPKSPLRDASPEAKAKFKKRFMTEPHIQSYFLSRIEQGDPTRNNQYTQWIINQYIAGKIKGLNDIPTTVHDMLERYEYAKQRNKLPAEYRDINKLDATLLYNIVKDINLAEPLVQKKQQRVKEIYNDSEMRIVQPLDELASCYYGQGTKWCTAGNNNNKFDYYNSDGPLYIILPKHPRYTGEKYQIHFNLNEFKNESEEDIHPRELLERFPRLRAALDFKNNFQDNPLKLLQVNEWTPEILSQAVKDPEDSQYIPHSLWTKELVQKAIQAGTGRNIPKAIWNAFRGNPDIT